MSLRFPPHPYQTEAFDMFFDRYEESGEGSLLLAFDTGVGKTFTAIAIGEDLLERRLVRKCVLTVPASLKYQWGEALAKFTDLPTVQAKVKHDGKTELLTIPSPDTCVIIDGTPDRRARQYELAGRSSVEYVIVGYDQLVDEWKQIRKLGCGYMVIDEASAIKTPGAKRTKAIKRHFSDVPFRLALTATPIENRPEDVFSIMEWVDASVLGRYDFFDQYYIERDGWGKVLRYKHLDVLNEKLSRAMVRKTRFDPDVAPYMPDVDHGVWTVELDDSTWDAYKSMLADLLASYDEPGVGFGTFNVDANYGMARNDKRGDKTALGRLMSVHQTMQMLLNHPQLVEESAHLYLNTDDKGCKYASDLLLSGFELPETQPKLNYLVRKVCEILEDPAAKVLVFTRSKMMLRIIQGLISCHGHPSVIYDGDLSVREKAAVVARFKNDPDMRLFLSSHAGAYGTDLPEANWLINYDIPWGAGLAHQIDGRHVRASSGFEKVHIRDMVCKGTIEERTREQKLFKNAISASAIDGKHGRNAELENDVSSLKSHAEEVLGLDLAMD